MADLRPAWGWPPASMTYQQDREDLPCHEAEIMAHQSFNYALFDDAEAALLGCVYIDPPESRAPMPRSAGGWWTGRSAPACRAPWTRWCLNGSPPPGLYRAALHRPRPVLGRLACLARHLTRRCLATCHRTTITTAACNPSRSGSSRRDPTRGRCAFSERSDDACQCALRCRVPHRTRLPRCPGEGGRARGADPGAGRELIEGRVLVHCR